MEMEIWITIAKKNMLILEHRRIVLKVRTSSIFIGWELSGCPSVCPSVRLSTLSNLNISEISWLIVIKFHQKHHWVGGLIALSFGLDRIRTLVSMATDSSHRVIMGKTL